MNAIMHYQNFIDGDETKLKPMIRYDLVGLDISTISRSE
jgi:DNA-directed RNA polymerase specialized sigma54-like protein